MMGGDWFYSRKPKVVTIPVQDGNRISPMFGNLQERKTMISLQNPGAGNDVPQEMMSENAAAILIQSHFRGYMVRRTDPLNSLRVISSVMSQLRKFKHRFRGMSTCISFVLIQRSVRSFLSQWLVS
ncbi:hypothetical protein O6H91_16G024400 [Diphasiastrum complanatum]|uniref:Uncharacterized protein n=1 Tax=Diphasiastrum complanatum TaxID=34168 RepID=A0ACC2BAT7_DIPCM|nr:hypothetical protein O6H91_16G024400 [Diphasiastrum complanatum]